MNLKKGELIKKFGKNIFFQENLSKYSWFNLGGPANILFKPESIEQLKNFLNYINNSSYILAMHLRYFKLTFFYFAYTLFSWTSPSRKLL